MQPQGSYREEGDGAFASACMFLVECPSKLLFCRVRDFLWQVSVSSAQAIRVYALQQEMALCFIHLGLPFSVLFFLGLCFIRLGLLFYLSFFSSRADLSSMQAFLFPFFPAWVWCSSI